MPVMCVCLCLCLRLCAWYGACVCSSRQNKLSLTNRIIIFVQIKWIARDSRSISRRRDITRVCVCDQKKEKTFSYTSSARTNTLLTQNCADDIRCPKQNPSSLLSHNRLCYYCWWWLCVVSPNAIFEANFIPKIFCKIRHQGTIVVIRVFAHSRILIMRSMATIFFSSFISNRMIMRRFHTLNHLDSPFFETTKQSLKINETNERIDRKKVKKTHTHTTESSIFHLWFAFICAMTSVHNVHNLEMHSSMRE